MNSLSLFALLACIILLGCFSQWLSWKIGVPSIVFLFAAGLAAGPLTGLISPDQLFGDLLFPAVSALIGIILFEGGLTLEFEDLENLHTPVLRVILLGGLTTFALTAVIAYYILGLSPALSLLLGGMLVVTGPTVVVPLLHQIRPNGDVGSVARWEGIIIDPLGAILAVVIFEVIMAKTAAAANGFLFGLYMFSATFAVGAVVGVIFGYLLTQLFAHYWVPDYLHNFTILAGVLTAQALANHFFHEAGLLSVTIMGVYMANQTKVTIRHILHFKEDLRVLFISILFIILVARLESAFLFDIPTHYFYFLGLLVVLVRPIAIFISTVGTKLSWAERGFLSWIAPRGIVAAAVASLFAKELHHAGVEQAGMLVDVTFFVIAGTVIIYGFTLGPLARFLGLADSPPQGVLLVGARRWMRALASSLQSKDITVRLIDKNRGRINRARQANLHAQHLDIVAESELQGVNTQGIGHFLALTSNDEVNSLATHHALDMGFKRSEVFQLSPESQYADQNESPDPFRGRILFDEKIDAETLKNRFNNQGRHIDTIAVDDELAEKDITDNDDMIPLIRINDAEDVDVFAVNYQFSINKGDKIIALTK